MEQVTKKQIDDANGEEQDPKKGLRDTVTLLLPDGLMIVRRDKEKLKV